MKKIFNAYKDAKVQLVVENLCNAFKIVLPNLNAEPIHVKTIDGNKAVVISLAEDINEVSRADVESKIVISTSTASLLLRRMVNDGLLVQNGTAKNTKSYPVK